MRPFLVLLCLSVLAFPAPAAADPPPNDDRLNASPITRLPARVTGTTQDATTEPSDPGTRCNAQTRNSVFYELRASQAGRVVVRLDAGGDLDAVVDVFRRTRSQLSAVACDPTDQAGNAQLSFRAREDEVYVIRVAQLSNSVSGTFQLLVDLAQPDAQPPGTPLPVGGRRDSVDRVLNPTDAWSVRLRAGVTYRINLAAPVDEERVRCVRLSVFEPGTRDFEGDSPKLTRSCGGYVLFTPRPGESGRYSLLVQAIRGRGALPYNVEVAAAGADDTAPGVFIRNEARVAGELKAGRIDVVDLYRFDVTRRSTLDLQLSTGASFDLVLLNDRGRRLECSCFGEGDQSIERRISPGRYFVAVRAQGDANGRYTLTRVSRAITSTRISVNGKRGTRVPPGASVRIGVAVAPRITGPVTVIVERFDPLAGWQFAYRYRVRVAGGSGGISFRPPHVGRWRARAEFTGTRTASPSESGYARVLVAGPLQE